MRSIYDIDDPDLAVEFVERLGVDLQDESCPPEIRQLGRTITKWRHQIAAWHRGSGVERTDRSDQEPHQAGQARADIGFRRFAHYRIRAPLYAGQPNWGLLPTVAPR